MRPPMWSHIHLEVCPEPTLCAQLVLQCPWSAPHRPPERLGKWRCSLSLLCQPCLCSLCG